MRVGFYLVPGFLYSPAALLLLLLLLLLFGGPPGEGARHLDMFFAGYLRLLSAPSSRVFTATITGKFSPSSPPLRRSLPLAPVAAKSSLLHQQHGESRREKENNRGNGAREGGFKPPLTTDKQHRRKEARERRKTPTDGRWSRFRSVETDSRAQLAVKYEFCRYPRLCFSTVGTPRAPWNRRRHAIGRPGGGGAWSRHSSPVPHAPHRTHSSAASTNEITLFRKLLLFLN